jgi:uncharacterized membrane protein YsdA (DUF1294 family)
MGLLTGYLLGMNAVAFVLYAIDKLKAKMDAWRISENVLIWMAILGGSVGALLAMIICRHKIRVPKFRFGVPVIILIQAALFLIKWNI